MRMQQHGVVIFGEIGELHPQTVTTEILRITVGASGGRKTYWAFCLPFVWLLSSCSGDVSAEDPMHGPVHSPHAEPLP